MSKEMNLQKAYKVMQKASRIKVGDKVKCLRHFEENEMGCYCMGSNKDSHKRLFVDDKATGVIVEIGERHIEVDCGHEYLDTWQFPFFALEVTEPVKTIEVKYFCDGKDVTDSISEETKRNLKEK